MSSLPEFTVFSRRGCHLCELLIEELIPLCRDRARIAVREVDDREEWRQAYGERVPVLCLAGREICAVELDHAAVLAALESARTRPDQSAP